MTSPSKEYRKAQKQQHNNNLPLTSPYLSGPIRPCRALSRDGGRVRTRSNPPPNNRNGRARSKSPAFADHRRKYSNGFDDAYSVNSVGSKGYLSTSSAAALKQNTSGRSGGRGTGGPIDEKNRTILLPTEVDETLREMGRFPIQVHLPFEFYKIYNKENKNVNLPTDDSDDDSSLESKYAEDLNDFHIFPISSSSPSKKQKYSISIEKERDFVKFPPVVVKPENDPVNDTDGSIVDDMKDNLLRRKKKIKKNRKLLKNELTDMVDAKMRTKNSKKITNTNPDSKKMMNSLLQPLSGSLSAKPSRTKTWM